jgi:hypothetical protein
MCPNKIRPRVIFLPDTKQVLKIGYGITNPEAEVMRLLALKREYLSLGLTELAKEKTLGTYLCRK